MRLLTFQADGKLHLTKDFIEDIPPYAILSHTWGEDDQEISFRDVTEGTGRGKAGYQKIYFCGQQATSDGLQYFWVDTCCIDKSNNTELSEAINSMFKWYEKATRCYVYLSDVSKDHRSQNDDLPRSTWKLAFRKSRWFTRGWTLQELIAPSSVDFFSAECQKLGDKNSLETLLHEITGVAIGALRGRALSEFTVEERMSWSEGRITKREEDRAYALLGIFKVHLSLIYGEGVENAFRRLREEISKRSVFAGRSLAVSGAYNQGIIESPTVRKELLELLYFDHIDERLLTIKAGHNTTCRWFLHTEQYKAWLSVETLRDHRGFLWVKGKPGTGKSTLMKFLDSKAKMTAKANRKVLVASFFFNARGEELERSTIGLYRSLLWQIFEKAEDLQGILDELDGSARRIIQRDGWQPEMLKETLAKVVEGLGCRTLQLFIDALDECHDDDVTDMISFFEDIRERAIETGVHLHICFSSRHYPAIIIPWGRQIVLEDEEEHDTDIAQYIKSKLTRQAESLRSQILEKSSGVFLWVALVIPMLNKVCAKGRIGEFQKCLDGIPPGLDDLFEMILTRDREDMQDLQLCIQWILFAKRPLKLEEYYFAICSFNDPDTARSWVSGDISLEAMHRFVHSSSKGLAEVTKTRGKDTVPNVQFIHESVRDFFLAKNGYRRLWPDLDGRFAIYSHGILKDRCLAEINGSTRSTTLVNGYSIRRIPGASSRVRLAISQHASELLPKASSSEASALRQTVSDELPFLEYAVHYVLYHADAAEENAIKQEAFLEEVPLKYWIYLDNIFEKYQIRRHTMDASFLYILAEKNLPRLIKGELRQVPSMDIPGERHKFPILAAYANSNREAVLALLMQQAGQQNDQSVALLLRHFPDYKAQGERPLLYAAQKGHEGIVKMLLDTGKVDPDSKAIADYGASQTPLICAAKEGHEGIVKMLLDTGKVSIDPKTIGKADPGRTPLSYAAEKGYEGIFKMLLDTGKVDVDSKITGRYNSGRTPLSYAAASGCEGIVRMLLDTGKVNIDSGATSISRDAGRTPLSYAAACGHKGIVKMLLDTGKVDVNSKSTSSYNYGRTPLSFAAANGSEAIVKMLLDTSKVDVDSKGSNIIAYRTPLSYAAENGHEGVVKMLLDTGEADADSKSTDLDFAGRTPLSYAAEKGHEGIVKILLSTGKVDCDSMATGILSAGWAPLHYAHRNGHIDIVELVRMRYR